MDFFVFTGIGLGFNFGSARKTIGRSGVDNQYTGVETVELPSTSDDANLIAFWIVFIFRHLPKPLISRASEASVVRL